VKKIMLNVNENNYKVYYKFLNSKTNQEEIKCVIVRALWEVTVGFWINSNFEFTKGKDSLYWIPPSQHILIKKMRNNNE